LFYQTGDGCGHQRFLIDPVNFIALNKRGPANNRTIRKELIDLWHQLEWI